ncbi:MAG: hypothetical protein DRP59_07845 [Spirochaetes bacterium]|nr:MAG: hypothetical protein DRP59_07845 [Spirochaetota bacterium]
MELSLFFLAIGINAIVVLVIYLNLKRQLRKSTDAASILDEIREDVEGLIVEINQITDRNVSIIEDKIKQLNQLLQGADKRITLLKREGDNNPIEMPRYNDLKKSSIKEIEHVRSEQKISKKEQVLGLHRNGFSPGIIASKTGISIGEVELIISLSSGKEN